MKSLESVMMSQLFSSFPKTKSHLLGWDWISRETGSLDVLTFLKYSWTRSQSSANSALLCSTPASGRTFCSASALHQELSSPSQIPCLCKWTMCGQGMSGGAVVHPERLFSGRASKNVAEYCCYCAIGVI